MWFLAYHLHLVEVGARRSKKKVWMAIRVVASTPDHFKFIAIHSHVSLFFQVEENPAGCFRLMAALCDDEIAHLRRDQGCH